MTSPTVAIATTASVWTRTVVRVSREERGEHSDREETERELARVTDLPVDREPADGPGADDEECDEREAAHHLHLRRSAGGGSAEGSMRGFPADQSHADTAPHDLASCGTGGLPARLRRRLRLGVAGPHRDRSRDGRSAKTPSRTPTRRNPTARRTSARASDRVSEAHPRER